MPVRAVAIVIVRYTVCIPALYLYDYPGYFTVINLIRNACLMFRLMKKQPSVIADVVFWHTNLYLWKGYMAVNTGSLQHSEPSKAPRSFLSPRIMVRFSNMRQSGSVNQTSSSPRTQAPTEAPSAPSPVRPGALLRHWRGPPSPRHNPPNGRSTRPSALPTASFPVGRPPSQ